MIQSLIRRVKQQEHGFTEIEKTAEEFFATNGHDMTAMMETARGLYASKIPQARMLATFLFGKIAARSKESLAFLHLRVSQDESWRVQEILAKAFDQYCKDIGYDRALPTIRDWLADTNPNARRAVTEGLRIWTARPYFDEHPQVAIQLLSPLRTDTSEYVRKSVGNALRDISKKHKDLIKAELKGWDLSDKHVQQVHKLASRLIKR
jgi:3-methyladenine DNA glycosylase AlkD